MQLMRMKLRLCFSSHLLVLYGHVTDSIDWSFLGGSLECCNSVWTLVIIGRVQHQSLQSLQSLNMAALLSVTVDAPRTLAAHAVPRFYCSFPYGLCGVRWFSKTVVVLNVLIGILRVASCLVSVV